MSKNILDAAEEYSGPRTCPHCGHQFPFGAFVRRTVMSYGLSKWACHGCQKMIKCDLIKLQFYWLLGLLPFGLLCGVFISYYNFKGLNVFFLIPFFAFMLFTFYHVKFKKAE